MKEPKGNITDTITDTIELPPSNELLDSCYNILSLELHAGLVIKHEPSCITIRVHVKVIDLPKYLTYLNKLGVLHLSHYVSKKLAEDKEFAALKAGDVSSCRNRVDYRLPSETVEVDNRQMDMF